jgi:CO dehydrogenase nickel-insertion accessory protein CooC1
MLKKFIKRIFDSSLFEIKVPQCKICNDSKRMEVLVMGTDTEFVECSYCSDKPEYKKFQESLKQNNQKLYIMTNEEIKLETEKMYAQIKGAEARLKELRTICKHEKTFEGNYSWRVGSIQLAEICEYCGEFIKYLD